MLFISALAAIVTATYAPLVHFSRHVMNIDPWVFCLLGLLCLVHGLRSQRLWVMAAAGFFFGFSLQLYISIRSLIFTAPLIAAYLACHRPQAISKMLPGWLLFGLAVLISFGPNIADLQVNRGTWFMSNRPGSSFIDIDTLKETMAAQQFQYIPSFALHQLKSAFLMVQVTNDLSGQMRGSETLFSSIVAPFVWLGLGVACASWSRNAAVAILLLITAVNLVLGQLMWSGIPYWPKLIITMFTCCFCVAIALQRTCEAAGSLAAGCLKLLGMPQHSSLTVLRPTLMIAALLLVFASAAVDLRRYFTVAPIPSSSPEVAGRYIMGLPENVTVCSRRQVYDIYVDKVELQFYGYGRHMKDFPEVPMVEASPLCGPRPFAWLITPDQTDLRDRLRALYPDGKLEEHPFSDGVNIFWSYFVP